MAAGRKANQLKAPRINAPTPVTQYNFTAPTGDSYKTWRNGNAEYSQSNLTPYTQTAIGASQYGLAGLAQDLAEPSPLMLQNIAQQSQDFYDLQAQGIDDESDAIYQDTASNLSQRFGGAYNATFGATTLGQIQNNRLNALAKARKEATLYGQDLYNQNQSNQINRFQVLNNYLNNQFDQASQLSTFGSNLLQNETNRAQNLALDQAKMQMQIDLANQQAANQAAQRRMALLKGATMLVGAAAAPFTAGQSATIASAVTSAM